MNPLVDRTRDYLEHLLPARLRGEVVAVPAPAVRFYLQDAFDFATVTLAGQPVLLAFARPDPPGGRLIDLLNALQAAVPGRVIYVAAALRPHERRRLIEAGVEFIVPGNQLFAPSLAMDLRETFLPAPFVAPDALGPSAQALLIHVLLHHQEAFTPSELAQHLGYTSMTATRAVRELATAGLISTDRQARRVVARLTGTPRQTWEKARPVLRSPVLRTHYARSLFEVDDNLVRIAGEDALARTTTLAHPRRAVLAIAAQDWRNVEPRAQVLRGDDESAIEVQVWRYSPAIGIEGDLVDPLSLVLSLQHIADPRVQGALEDLERNLWR